jgi:ribosomal protein S12 methylthiotransferase accessory factor
LTRNQTCFLPTQFCYYQYPASAGIVYSIANSNGNAAGNTLEEAILQGVLELVERDSVAIWWYNKISRPMVDWESFELPYLEEVRKYYQTHNREFWIIDITTDLEIPAFAAISCRLDDAKQNLLAGFGAHLDARVALLRAITELNQSMVWNFEIHYPAPTPPNFNKNMPKRKNSNTVTLTNSPYLASDIKKSTLTASDYSRLWTDDIKEDVLVCKNMIEKQGMEMFVLDQTRPDIGLPVVKVIVPGLRHFWPRFGPGRLYDVPVRLGWLSKPLTEEQLNAIVIF